MLEHCSFARKSNRTPGPQYRSGGCIPHACNESDGMPENKLGKAAVVVVLFAVPRPINCAWLAHFSEAAA